MMLRKLNDMVRNRRHREVLYSAPEYWDSKAAEFQGHAVSMWPNNNLNALYHTEQLKILGDAFADLTGKDVLDVGCGTGRTSRWLVSRNARVVGIDFSAKSIAIAAREGPQGNPTYRHQSMFELDEVNRYDAIVCWGSITVACRSSRDVEDVMRRLQRALRPEGNAILLEPVHKGFLHRVLNMDVSEFSRIMSAAGFRIESITRMHFWPVRLALAFVPWPNWITVPIYHLGQFVMRIPGFRSMGDYTAIRAVATTEHGRHKL